MAAPSLVTFAPGVVVMDPAWERTINNELRHTFRLIANEVEAVARWYAPIKTGELVGKVKAYVRQPAGTIYVEVVTGAEHGPYQEYGTGTRGRQTQNQAIGASAADMRKVSKGTYSHGRKKGHAAQPHIRPAVIQVIRRHFSWGVTS